MHADETLDQVAGWLRAYHRAVADFVPPHDAVWRGGSRWEPGLLIGHNDAAPYNAAWRDGRLTGFFDWDFASPVTAQWDLAFAAFSWVPLHARHVVAPEGFTDFAGRPRRLRRFLTAYGWSGQAEDFLDVVRERITAHAAGIRARADEPAFGEMVRNGVVDSLDRAVEELDGFTMT